MITTKWTDKNGLDREWTSKKGEYDLQETWDQFYDRADAELAAALKRWPRKEQ